MEHKWIVTFAFSGTSRREFFNSEFVLEPGQSIDKAISDYVAGQNKGEAKSDRIRYWSKKRITSKTPSP